MLQGSAAQGYGNALANAIVGTGGDNVLDGDTGADTMFGGAGNDAYLLDNIGDSVIENANEGSDTVYAIGQLPAVGERGVSGAARRRCRAGLRQRPVECDLRHRRGQPARRRCRCRLDVWRGRQRRVFPRQHRRRGGRERQRGQRHGLCDRPTTGCWRTWRTWCCWAPPPRATATPCRTRSTAPAADNLLDGDTGADAMYGLAGNDAYFVDNAGDFVIENLNEGVGPGLRHCQLHAGGEYGKPGAAGLRRSEWNRQHALERHLRQHRRQHA